MEEYRKQLLEVFAINRKNKGISQKKLSQITGIDQGDISKIETGKTNVSLDTLIRFANGIDMEIEVTLIPKKTDKIYYEEQTNWDIKNYNYLHRYLHRMIYYHNKYRDEIEKINLNKISPETKVLIYCIIKYYHFEFLFENENLKELSNVQPLTRPLIIDDNPLNEDNIYKEMNIII